MNISRINSFGNIKRQIKTNFSTNIKNQTNSISNNAKSNAHELTSNYNKTIVFCGKIDTSSTKALSLKKGQKLYNEYVSKIKPDEIKKHAEELKQKLEEANNNHPDFRKIRYGFISDFIQFGKTQEIPRDGIFVTAYINKKRGDVILEKAYEDGRIFFEHIIGDSTYTYQMVKDENVKAICIETKREFNHSINKESYCLCDDGDFMYTSSHDSDNHDLFKFKNINFNCTKNSLDSEQGSVDFNLLRKPDDKKAIDDACEEFKITMGKDYFIDNNTNTAYRIKDGQVVELTTVDNTTTTTLDSTFADLVK